MSLLKLLTEFSSIVTEDFRAFCCSHSWDNSFNSPSPVFRNSREGHSGEENGFTEVACMGGSNSSSTTGVEHSESRRGHSGEEVDFTITSSSAN